MKALGESLAFFYVKNLKFELYIWELLVIEDST